MSQIRTRAIGVMLAIVAAATCVLAQGSLQERVHYTINIPHALEVGGYLLPPGKYVIHQVNTTDKTLFALYRDDMTGTPIATLRTTRQDYQSGNYPEDAKIRLEIEEVPARANPVLNGWSIPGQDGWKIIGVDADDDEYLKRLP